MSRIEELSAYQSAFVEGREYQWQIKEIGEKVPTAKSHYRTWIFTTFIDGNVEEMRVNMFPWQAAEIAEILGFKKENGKVKVDYDQIEGKSLFAKVVFEKYVKNGEERTGKRLDSFRFDKDEIPF